MFPSQRSGQIDKPDMTPTTVRVVGDPFFYQAPNGERRIAERGEVLVFPMHEALNLLGTGRVDFANGSRKAAKF